MTRSGRPLRLPPSVMRTASGEGGRRRRRHGGAGRGTLLAMGAPGDRWGSYPIPPRVVNAMRRSSAAQARSWGIRRRVPEDLYRRDNPRRWRKMGIQALLLAIPTNLEVSGTPADLSAHLSGDATTGCLRR